MALSDDLRRNITENGERKKRVRRTVLLVCLVLAAAVIARYFLIPVSVLPKKYSTMECRYIRIGGQMYEPKDGFPTEEQISQIEEILKKYSMKHTTKPFRDTIGYGYSKLYVVLTFMNENGVITDTRGINIDDDMVASTRVRPFIDSLAVIENGETLYKDIMAVLGRNP